MVVSINEPLILTISVKNGDSELIHLTHMQDQVFNAWSMTLMGEFDWDSFVKVDRSMAQILCGTYFALVSVVCMNLYIALLSDTFARVYGLAKGMQLFILLY